MKALIRQYLSSPRNWDSFEAETRLEREIIAQSRPTVAWRLEKDGRVWKHFRSPMENPLVVIHDVAPGKYRLTLETGLTVWAAELTEEEVITPSLKLAAGSLDEFLEPSRKESLLENSLVLKVFPGVDSGHISLEG